MSSYSYSIIFILSCICLFVTSCEGDIDKFIIENDILENPRTPLEKMAVNSYNKTYLQDFPVYLRPEIAATKVGDDYFKVKIDAGSNNIESLRASFPRAKQVITELAAQNNESNNALIQEIGLRYLRNYLLVINESSTQKREIVFLLNEMMKTSPVDLDVIVDSYIAVEDILSRDDKSDIKSYVLENIESRESENAEQLLLAEQSFEAATDNSTKLLALIKGMHHQRAAKTFEYAEQKLRTSTLD